MHLLVRGQGVVADGEEAIDLAQRPGDLIFLSAADTELALLAHAHDALGDVSLSLRLVNLMSLRHHLSVDLYVERTLSRAKLVVLRLLGGESYWSYGLERVEACCRACGIALAVLPGDAVSDPALMARGGIDTEWSVRLWQYLVEGGLENATLFLRACSFLMGRSDAQSPPPARPLPRSGLYWPGRSAPLLEHLRAEWRSDAPVALITFYRALLETGNTAPVDALVASLLSRGLNPLPVHVSSLKDERGAVLLSGLIAATGPAIVLNATGFAVSAYDGGDSLNPFSAADCPVLQLIFSGSSEAAWQAGDQGLSARDLAMNVVLPELDGRVVTRAVSFKSEPVRHEATDSDVVTYTPRADRIDFVSDLAANWARLRSTPASQRRVAIVLANYPNQDGRIGNGVGYDAPASTVALLSRLREEGYAIDWIPDSGTDLIERLLKGPTNRADRAQMSHAQMSGDVTLTLTHYHRAFARLSENTRQRMTDRWGEPENDPFFHDGAFHLAILRNGSVPIAIQPARGYNIDPAGAYHDPSLPPPHNYFAFHVWLREIFDVHAIIHNGKHGNLEWLPGKALALSRDCFPEAMSGPVPHFYPFIVNDPGEGSQAKRRTAAVIIDHLTPPLTRAETYGPLKDLEALIDEYYLASGLDPRRVASLRRTILDLTRRTGLDQDAGLSDDDDVAMQRLDTYICELKEAQIRDGLHILGVSPSGHLETNLLIALARVPRRLGVGGDQSLHRAIALDFVLDFDPLDCDQGSVWSLCRPQSLMEIHHAPWRTYGDAVERIELFAIALLEERCEAPGARTRAVLDAIRDEIRLALRSCGPCELDHLMRGLSGRFVPPGASGAPTRGRVDVLPTGRNFFSIDNRTVPTPTAWNLGKRSAALLVQRYFQDHGVYPRALGLSVWGTANMRTGGDDIAQAMSLLGVEPRWDRTSWRVIGFDILSLAQLGRPRVDVTLRISGFFRDAFPMQIDLFDSAARAVAGLEEENESDNPLAARVRRDAASLMEAGLEKDDALRRAGCRIFGSKPGSYGAGLQALIDERLWDDRAMLADSYINWGAYAYGAGEGGRRAESEFRQRLGHMDAVVHNQDNREHDLLDSDDYYQFEGGMSVAAEHVSGVRPSVYHGDHSRPERPVIRTLEEEIGRVVRSRVVNPKWIAGVMRHGYKGVFEIAATVDYMFAFAATTGAVRHHHFELAYQAFIEDDAVRGFMADHNPAALAELSQRFLEAMERNLWTPRSNRAYHDLHALACRSDPGSHTGEEKNTGEE